jgi:hypothetical protein
LPTDVDDLDLEEDFDDLDVEEEEKRATKKKASGKAKPKGIGASAVAEKLGVDPKTFRAWLRRKTAAGDINVADHEHKQRYTWENWKDSELVAIMKAWNEDSHERGGAKKGTASKKKPAAKKKASTRRKKASS